MRSRRSEEHTSELQSHSDLHSFPTRRSSDLNFGVLEPADARVEGFNPLCGDRLTVQLKMAGDAIADIRFEGQGCAISTASASLMTEAVKGKSRTEALALFDRIHSLLT